MKKQISGFYRIVNTQRVLNLVNAEVLNYKDDQYQIKYYRYDNLIWVIKHNSRIDNKRD